METPESRKASDQLRPEKSEAELKYDISPRVPSACLISWLERDWQNAQLGSKKETDVFCASTRGRCPSPGKAGGSPGARLRSEGSASLSVGSGGFIC